MAHLVPCPTCKKEISWTTENPFRPFCSQRCKQIDLGAWAEEKYIIPSTTPTEHIEDQDPNNT